MININTRLGRAMSALAALLVANLTVTTGTHYPAGDTVVADWKTGTNARELRYWGVYTSSNQAGTFTVSVSDPFAHPGLTIYPIPPLASSKTYDVFSQDLLSETSFVYPSRSNDLRLARVMPAPTYYSQRVVSDTTYNFAGAPLSKTIEERTYTSNSSYTTSRTATVEYGYWGYDKYFQQKFVKDQGGRVSFTDYYDRSATQGKKGQTYRVYAEAHADFSPKTGSDWKGTIAVVSGDYSAQFDYDTKGRPTNVLKLDPSGSGHVETQTTYYAEGSPGYGAAHTVTEAVGETTTEYGSEEDLFRTTTTLAYDPAGRATQVEDAKGQIFETTYDDDGLVQHVYRIDNSLNKLVVDYEYGATNGTPENGMVVKVSDGLSESVQEISYVQSGSSEGQVQVLKETIDNGLNGTSDDKRFEYETTYSYDDLGRRDTSHYKTYKVDPGMTTWTTENQYWRYSDYVYVGSPESASVALQTLTKLDSGQAATAEEFHYQYDTGGRITNASFAQSSSQSSAPFYSSTNLATRRARAFYAYDPGGRVKSIEHYWDTLSGGTYSSTPILANEAVYESSGFNRGIKTQSKFYNNSGGSWNLTRTEEFDYDDDRDYLVGADYNDGLANEVATWTYDAAGNRNSQSCTYDELNQITACSTFNYIHDELGNRLERKTISNNVVTTYAWDEVNRLTNFNSLWNYSYRADGMRTAKWKTGAGVTATVYRYDGQMGFQDISYGTSTLDSWLNTINYALGARGIDMIQKTTSSGTTTVFPIYDAHGNNVASLSRNGTSYSLADERIYDAWGRVRTSNTTGDPRSRYTANLGHKQDDETDLIYMRARYYEPGRGRFISEDPTRDRTNWYAYCNNNPVDRIDRSGKNDELILNFAEAYLAVHGVSSLVAGAMMSSSGRGIAIAGLTFLAYWFNCGPGMASERTDEFGGRVVLGLFMLIPTMAFGNSFGNASPANRALSVALAYSGIIALFLDLEIYASGL